MQKNQNNKTYKIYKMEFPNGMFYIGLTGEKNIRTRLTKHLSRAYAHPDGCKLVHEQFKSFKIKTLKDFDEKGCKMETIYKVEPNDIVSARDWEKYYISINKMASPLKSLNQEKINYKLIAEVELMKIIKGIRGE